jgi:hypothetical protein
MLPKRSIPRKPAASKRSRVGHSQRRRDSGTWDSPKRGAPAVMVLPAACFRLLFTGAAKENFVGWGIGIGHRRRRSSPPPFAAAPAALYGWANPTIVHR